MTVTGVTWAGNATNPTPAASTVGNPLSNLKTVYPTPTTKTTTTTKTAPTTKTVPISTTPATGSKSNSTVASVRAPTTSNPSLPDTVLPPQHNLMTFGGYLSDRAAGTPLDIAKAYLTAHARDLGISASDLTATVVTDQYTDADTGVTHIYLRQLYNGLSVTNSNLVINVMRDGRILNVAGGLVAGLGSSAVAPVPAVTAAQALQSASTLLGLQLTTVPITIPHLTGSGSSVTLTATGVSTEQIPANLRYLWTPGGVKLVWDLVIDPPDHQHWYDVSVDAASNSGQILAGADWVDHASYNVFPLPTENPNDGAQTVLTDPASPTYSPFGWHDTNGVAGAEYTITRGNNAYAYIDSSATDTPGFSPDGTAALNFNFVPDFNQAPSTTVNQSAGVTNLFYLNNLLHDVHAAYGFTEAAGNFQTLNYTGQGLGNDAVLAEAQDGAGTDNANFATPVEVRPLGCRCTSGTTAPPTATGIWTTGSSFTNTGTGSPTA